MANSETSEQRSGGTEAERRQDGAGRTEAHPAGEAARGNKEPEVSAPEEEHATRSGTGPDGGTFTVEEDSGSAAAAPKAAEQAKAAD